MLRDAIDPLNDAAKSAFVAKWHWLHEGIEPWQEDSIEDTYKAVAAHVGGNVVKRVTDMVDGGF